MGHLDNFWANYKHIKNYARRQQMGIGLVTTTMRFCLYSRMLEEVLFNRHD
jgi:hypothetical protein